MSIDLQQAIKDEAQALSDSEKRQVLDFIKNLSKQNRRVKPISAIFDDLSSEMPLDDWKELPTDGAENHDHYLYGAPKKSK